MNADGGYGIDLSGVPPAEILDLLALNMQATARQELLGALGMNLIIPLDAGDGPIGILTIPVELDQETVALLASLLDDASLAELNAALDGG